jgi:hypothetical protein
MAKPKMPTPQDIDYPEADLTSLLGPLFVGTVGGFFYGIKNAPPLQTMVSGLLGAVVGFIAGGLGSLFANATQTNYHIDFATDRMRMRLAPTADLLKWEREKAALIRKLMAEGKLLYSLPKDASYYTHYLRWQDSDALRSTKNLFVLPFGEKFYLTNDGIMEFQKWLKAWRHEADQSIWEVECRKEREKELRDYRSIMRSFGSYIRSIKALNDDGSLPFNVSASIAPTTPVFDAQVRAQNTAATAPSSTSEARRYSLRSNARNS